MPEKLRFRAGSAEEAWVQMETALAPGIKDAKFFYHAGCIRAALADSERATHYWERSFGSTPILKWPRRRNRPSLSSPIPERRN